MTDAPERYGNRRIDRMYRDWSSLREAVASNPDEATQAAFDRCEEWVDFAFGKSADLSAAQGGEVERLRAEVNELGTLEGASRTVLRYITDPHWADKNSETFRTTPWQALYDELRKDANDFPALLRSHLEAFCDPEFRAFLALVAENQGCSFDGGHPEPMIVINRDGLTLQNCVIRPINNGDAEND